MILPRFLRLGGGCAGGWKVGEAGGRGGGFLRGGTVPGISDGGCTFGEKEVCTSQILRNAMAGQPGVASSSFWDTVVPGFQALVHPAGPRSSMPCKGARISQRNSAVESNTITSHDSGLDELMSDDNCVVAGCKFAELQCYAHAIVAAVGKSQHRRLMMSTLTSCHCDPRIPRRPVLSNTRRRIGPDLTVPPRASTGTSPPCIFPCDRATRTPRE